MHKDLGYNFKLFDMKMWPSFKINDNKLTLKRPNVGLSDEDIKANITISIKVKENMLIINENTGNQTETIKKGNSRTKSHNILS